mgnify:CR=1 FL=1
MADNKTIESKIVFLGAASVGKTSIICRAVSDEFDAEMPATIGACYTAKKVEINGTSVNLQIWDTAGQERFRTLAPMYYRGSVIAVLVFSLVESSSLDDVKNWASEIKKQTEEMPKLFVVGNKMDLENERQVTTAQGEAVAKELEAIYVEVSAKSGRGVDDLVVNIAEESVKKLSSNNSGPQQPSSGVDINQKSDKGGKKCC